MSNMIQILNVAVTNKLKFGSPCNSCGYCAKTQQEVINEMVSDGVMQYEN